MTQQIFLYNSQYTANSITVRRKTNYNNVIQQHSHKKQIRLNTNVKKGRVKCSI